MNDSYDASFKWLHDLHWMLYATQMLVLVIKYTLENTSATFSLISIAVIPLETQNVKQTSLFNVFFFIVKITWCTPGHKQTAVKHTLIDIWRLRLHTNISKLVAIKESIHSGSNLILSVCTYIYDFVALPPNLS